MPVENSLRKWGLAGRERRWTWVSACIGKGCVRGWDGRARRWHWAMGGVGLAFNRSAVATGISSSGFLSCQRTSARFGRDPVSDRGSGAASVGGPAMPRSSAWPTEESSPSHRLAPCATRSREIGDPPGMELFSNSPATYQLSGGCPARVADWQRLGGISVCSKAGTLQTAWSVLDSEWRP